MLMEQVHEPTLWPPLFFQLSRDSFSGVVSLEAEAVARNFYFYFGEVLACSKSSGGDSELSAIYSKRATVSREIAAGLIAEKGKVIVSSREFEGDEFSVGVERRVDVWSAMLRGVQGSPLLGSVGPGDARRLVLSLTERGREIIEVAGEVSSTTISSDAIWLLKEITEPITLSRLRTRAGVGENIRGLIWLLESLGLLEQVASKEQEETVLPPSPTEIPPTPEPTIVASEPKTPPVLNMDLPEPILRSQRVPEIEDLGDRPSDPIDGLRWEYNARMGFGFYRFLGMDRSSTAIDLVVECRKVMQRLHGAQRSNELPNDVEQMVTEMLTALTLVFSTFSDQRRKELYDTALANGEAKSLEKSSSHSPQYIDSSLPSKEQARSFSPPSKEQENWSFWKKGKN